MSKQILQTSGFWITALAALLSLTTASYEMTMLIALVGWSLVFISTLRKMPDIYFLLIVAAVLLLAHYISLPWPAEWAPLGRLTATAVAWLAVTGVTYFVADRTEKMVRGRIAANKNRAT